MVEEESTYRIPPPEIASFVERPQYPGIRCVLETGGSFGAFLPHSISSLSTNPRRQLTYLTHSYQLAMQYLSEPQDGALHV